MIENFGLPLCIERTQVRDQNAVVPGGEDCVSVRADVEAPDLAVDLLDAVLDKVGLEADELQKSFLLLSCSLSLISLV